MVLPLRLTASSPPHQTRRPSGCSSSWAQRRMRNTWPTNCLPSSMRSASRTAKMPSGRKQPGQCCPAGHKVVIGLWCIGPDLAAFISLQVAEVRGGRGGWRGTLEQTLRCHLVAPQPVWAAELHHQRQRAAWHACRLHWGDRRWQLPSNMQHAPINLDSTATFFFVGLLRTFSLIFNIGKQHRLTWIVHIGLPQNHIFLYGHDVIKLGQILHTGPLKLCKNTTILAFP